MSCGDSVELATFEQILAQAWSSIPKCDAHSAASIAGAVP